MIKKDALFILDGSYLLYRSYYGLTPLKTSTGIPTQATYGFCRTLKKMIDQYDPQSFVIVWDSKGPTFRTDIYKEYKATRQAAPSDLQLQKEYIMNILGSMNICQVALSGYEADDLIATIIHHEKKHQIALICPDKDMFQLLHGNMLIIDPFKDQIITQESYEQKMGFPTNRLAFYFSLLGDSSDNIPGVKGIGEKTAQKLATQFSSLDDLYEHIDDVEPKGLRQKLIDDKDNGYLSFKLFELKPIALDYDDAQFSFDKSGWQNAMPIFQKLEFKSFLKDAAISAPPAPQAESKPWTCIVVQTEDDLKKMIASIEQAGFCALDTETNGKHFMQADLIGISFAINTHEAYYIPFKHLASPSYQQIDRDRALELLKPMLENNKIAKIMHHAQFDEIILINHGINITGTTFDTIIAASLFRKEDKINLKDLSMEYLHEPMKKFKDVLGKQYKQFGEVPIEEAAPYGAYDSLQTLKLAQVFTKLFESEPTLKQLHDTLDLPFQEILIEMERKGILLDESVLKTLEQKITKQCSAIEEKIFAAVQHIDSQRFKTLNLNSPKQIEALLFDVLGLDPVRKSKKGTRSTDHEVLEKLSTIHPIPALIVTYRELSKLKNTYLEPLPTFVDPTTKRIHTSFSQTLVATGRLSSSQPNLQNIPTSPGVGLELRSAFIAPPGYRFISADYSQIELRILAHLSQDAVLLDTFNHNRDIHTETAAQILGIKSSEVSHEMRQLGKRINFSIMYGLTPYGLSQDLGISPSEAKKYIEAYFTRYAGVAAWMEKTVAFTKEHGYSQTLYGRRRSIPAIHEKNHHLFEAARRIAINSPVQGTQADLMKMSMLALNKKLKKAGLDATFILQIHDEVILEVHHKDTDPAQAIIKETMESIVHWKIPLTVSLRTGSDWGEISK